MADRDSCIKQHQLVKEQNQANPSKYYKNFLYKLAVVVLIFLVIVPVFPSQAPEFINQTLLNGSWELLHLLFVGIAVSYGLFSRRNEETEKENNNKFDSVQSFVSSLLQVSPVFDDEAENLSGTSDDDHNHQSSRVQTWSSQYRRNEPPVVVANEHGSSSSGIAEKPLLLPVRSLKSRVSEANKFENTGEIGANYSSLTRSNSSLSSKRFSNRGTNGEIMESFDQETNLVEKMNENNDNNNNNNNNVVLPSPIPWRSSSFRSQSTRLSSPKKLSPSPSLSTEAQAKTAEDSVRRKSIYRSPPPPPPTPPPPLSMKLNRESVSFMPKPNYMEFPHGEKQELVEKLVVETTDDDDDEEEEEEEEEEVGESSFVSSVERGSNNNETAADSPSSGIDGGCDVDKKADEFIAKVREQIRLQRIDSIKRSSAHMNRNNIR